MQARIVPGRSGARIMPKIGYNWIFKWICGKKTTANVTVCNSA